MLENDMLIKFSHQEGFLSQYQEGMISFLPTYKFDTNSDAYDTSKKQRIPSWYDPS